MQFNTPLRYPGGKGKLTDFIKLVFERNDLLDGNYVEVYAGGAAMASLAPLEQPTSSKRRDAGRREVWPMIMERVNMLQKVSFSSERSAVK